MNNDTGSNDLTIAPSISSHPSWIRLEDQLGWYELKSQFNQKRYKGWKTVQIILSVAIPALTLLPDDWSKWAVSVAGVMIAVLEALQQLNQYSTLWWTYRETAERLKHEKFLFLSVGGPYRGMAEQDRLVSMAERIEDIITAENSGWLQESRKGSEPKKTEAAT